MENKINIGITSHSEIIEDKISIFNYAIKKNIHYIANNTVMQPDIPKMHKLFNTMSEVLKDAKKDTVLCSYPLYDYYKHIETDDPMSLMDIIESHYNLGYRAIVICVTPFETIAKYDTYNLHTDHGEILNTLRISNECVENPAFLDLQKIENFCHKKKIELFIDLLFKPVTISENTQAYNYECEMIDELVNFAGTIFEIGGSFSTISEANVIQPHQEKSLVYKVLNHNHCNINIFEKCCITGPLISDVIDKVDTALFGIKLLRDILKHPQHVDIVQILLEPNVNFEDAIINIDKYVNYSYLENLHNREYIETLNEFKTVDYYNLNALKAKDKPQNPIKKKEIYAPILVIGAPNSDITSFAKIFVEDNNKYKYFNIIDYLKSEEISVDNPANITVDMLKYACSSRKHSHTIFDSPFCSLDTMRTFHEQYNLNNYVIVYISCNQSEPILSTKPSQMIEMIDNVKDYFDNDEETKILGFLKQHDIKFKFVQKIYNQ